MANKKKEAPAEKKQTLSVEEKVKLIKEVEKKLSPELNRLFKAYSGLSKNPQLSKNLQNPNTDWESVLTKWNDKRKAQSKARLEKKGKAISNPLTFLSKIEDEVKKDSFDGFQSAIGYCQELLKVLEEKKERKQQEKIAANEAMILKLQEENKQLKGE